MRRGIRLTAPNENFSLLSVCWPNHTPCANFGQAKLFDDLERRNLNHQLPPSRSHLTPSHIQLVIDFLLVYATLDCWRKNAMFGVVFVAYLFEQRKESN